MLLCEMAGGGEGGGDGIPPHQTWGIPARHGVPLPDMGYPPPPQTWDGVPPHHPDLAGVPPPT